MHPNRYDWIKAHQKIGARNHHQHQPQRENHPSQHPGHGKTETRIALHEGEKHRTQSNKPAGQNA